MLGFRSRLTGERRQAPPELAVGGEWVFEGTEAVTLNDCLLPLGGSLVPDLEGRWVLRPELGPILEGRFHKDQLPDPTLSRATSDLLDNLQPGDRPFRWDDARSVSPVVPRLSQRVQIMEFERQLDARLWHLESVCFRPRMLLKTEVDREPVGRVRRLPLHATEYLAAHPDDWERRTVGSVLPRRILSLYVDDEIDIYENRVAARLVDELLHYVVGRVSEVAHFLRVFEQAKRFSSDTVDLSWPKRRRVCDLWGDALDVDVGRSQACTTLELLENLRHRLRKLLDSPVYVGTTARGSIRGALRPTNILANDQHYREVAALWRERERMRHAERRTPQEIFAAQQKAERGFEAFCELLIVRALDAMGWQAVKGSASGADQNIVTLSRPGVDQHLICRRLPDGVVELDGVGLRRPVRIVPWFTQLDAEASADVLRETLERVSDGGGSSELVVLYPGDPEARRTLPKRLQARLTSGGLPHTGSGRTSVSFTPVSPLELDSQERVERLVRSRLTPSRWATYPPRLKPTTSIATELLAVAGTSWRRESSDLVLLRPMAPESVERALEAAADAGRNGRSRRPTRGSARDAEVRALREQIAGANVLHMEVSRCPVCDTTAGEAQVGDRGFFSFTCAECNTVWGMQVCGACKDRFPFVRPPAPSSAIAPGDPDAAERAFGRDLLASPCWVDSAIEDFICTACGVCPNARRSAGACCGRCHDLPST